MGPVVTIATTLTRKVSGLHGALPLMHPCGNSGGANRISFVLCGGMDAEMPGSDRTHRWL
jgi:hypothetical protein